MPEVGDGDVSARIRRFSSCRSLAAAALMLPLAARAASALPVTCAPDGAETAIVRSVDRDGSLLLEDGRRLRLAGIDPVHDTPDRPGAAAAAREALAGWLDGRAVAMRTAGPPDRWSRIAATVFAPAAAGGAGQLEVGVAMVDAGLARVMPDGVATGCASALASAEQAARSARLGLWADPYYAVRDASEGPALLSLAGEWVVVEGRVAHVGRTRAATFLDLGRRGSLALRLGKGVSFTSGQGAAGQDDWVGKRVRARGVLEDRSGPRLDIRDPAQLEVLPEPGTPADAVAPLGGAADAGD